MHGDSIGVHASDAAHAWRTIALASNSRQRNAAIVLSAWQAAQDRSQRREEFEKWEPRPLQQHLERVKPADQAGLLGVLHEAIQANDQDLACAVASRYGSTGHTEGPAIELLRGYAVGQDGALHAEKYYQHRVFELPVDVAGDAVEAPGGAGARDGQRVWAAGSRS